MTAMIKAPSNTGDRRNDHIVPFHNDDDGVGSGWWVRRFG